MVLTCVWSFINKVPRVIFQTTTPLCFAYNLTLNKKLIELALITCRYTLYNNILDDLILLAKGGMAVYHGRVKKVEEYFGMAVYHGRVKKVEEYFTGLGIAVPDCMNASAYYKLVDVGILKYFIFI
jgi:hypothetical protein